MPVYRFYIDIDVPPPVAEERLKTATIQDSNFWYSLRMIWRWPEPGSPPFLGKIENDSFRLRRNIRYRNSFLPLIRGQVSSRGVGSRVSVTMSIHPFTALFMAFWLGSVGYGALTDKSTQPVYLWAMFAFGVGLAAVGFFPEAIRAKRLICEALLNKSAVGVGNSPVQR